MPNESIYQTVSSLKSDSSGSMPFNNDNAESAAFTVADSAEAQIPPPSSASPRNPDVES